MYDIRSSVPSSTQYIPANVASVAIPIADRTAERHRDYRVPRGTTGRGRTGTGHRPRHRDRPPPPRRARCDNAETQKPGQTTRSRKHCRAKCDAHSDQRVSSLWCRAVAARRAAVCVNRRRRLGYIIEWTCERAPLTRAIRTRSPSGTHWYMYSNREAQDVQRSTRVSTRVARRDAD